MSQGQSELQIRTVGLTIAFKPETWGQMGQGAPATRLPHPTFQVNQQLCLWTGGARHLNVAPFATPELAGIKAAVTLGTARLYSCPGAAHIDPCHAI